LVKEDFQGNGELEPAVVGRQVIRVPDVDVHRSVVSKPRDVLAYYWTQVLKHPEDWWNNRQMRKNPKAPDF